MNDPELPPPPPAAQADRIPPYPKRQARRGWWSGTVVVAAIISGAVMLALLGATAQVDKASHAVTGPETSFIPPPAASVGPTTLVRLGSVAAFVTPTGVWVANREDHSVALVDPASGLIRSTDPVPGGGATGGPERVALGEGAVWVAVSASDDYFKPEPGQLVRLDTTTGGVVATIPLGLYFDGQIAISPGSVWVPQWYDDTLTRVDTAANRVVASVQLPDNPVGVAFAGGAIWASGGNGGLYRVDPATNRIVATYQAADTAGEVAVDGSSLWLANPGRIGGSGGVSEFDLVTDKATTATALDGSTFHAIVAGGSVWADDYDVGTVYRVDEKTGRLIETVHVVGDVQGLAAGVRQIWVVSHAWGSSDGQIARISF